MHSDRSTGLRVACVLALVAALSACETPSVDAGGPPYNPTALTGGKLYHWPLGRSINFYVVPGPTAGDERLASGVDTALTEWEDVLVYREHSLRRVADIAAADIIVRDARVPAPVETNCAGTGWSHSTATAIFCPLSDSVRTLTRVDGGPSRAKFLITIDVPASASRISGLFPVILHEIGHAIGIGGHSPRTTDVMFSIPGMRAPSHDDALTLRYVLHRRPELRL